MHYQGPFGKFSPRTVRRVAQLGSALRSGRRGRRFESSHTDHIGKGRSSSGLFAFGMPRCHEASPRHCPSLSGPSSFMQSHAPRDGHAHPVHSPLSRAPCSSTAFASTRRSSTDPLQTVIPLWWLLDSPCTWRVALTVCWTRCRAFTPSRRHRLAWRQASQQGDGTSDIATTSINRDTASPMLVWFNYQRLVVNLDG